MENFKDKVAVIGFGVAKTGELWDKGIEDMLFDACTEALTDAKVEMKDIQAGFLGVYYSRGAQLLASTMKTGMMPISVVENACATGADAFRTAAAFVAGGLYDMVLVAGVEKMKDAGTTGIRVGGGMGGSDVHAGTAPPVNFGLMAVRYMHQYGLTYEQLKETLGHIAIKNHRNGVLNPKAAFQKEISWDQYINAPWISWPLGLYDCCANIDGAAACVICKPEIARHIKDNYALLKASALAVGDRTNSIHQRYDYVHVDENLVAARIAYEQAGIKDPAKELSTAEVHDAFTVNELVICEDLGFAPHGRGHEYVRAGFFDREGELPVNTDGGLKCFGHPVGATGLKGLYESYEQSAGKAGARQVKNPRLALSHSMGGASGTFSTVINILGPRD
ncbi:MAG: acetyl-CoA acetyltransferase [Chloroflexi bacterium]|nr:acetyl-CoA acetyltransferase [Chloroflexota bacterium]